jgi:hypothetical protein
VREMRATEQAQGLAGDGGSFYALSVRSDVPPADWPDDALAVRLEPDLDQEHRCPSCGECYPQKGTCWGYGPDRHPPIQTERVRV